MKFTEIDMNTWHRKLYFENFTNNIRCTYSMTLNLDITSLLLLLKQKNIKLYPTLIYMITRIVNKHIEYRTCYNSKRVLGYYDKMNPTYTVFHKETETFSNIWSEYKDNFYDFYESYLYDIKLYGQIEKISAKPNTPENIFPISAVPWVSFTGFNLNVYNDGMYFLPIFTIGKYFNENNKYFLPLSIQHHHAVADGFHISRFINELQELANNINL